MAYNILKGSVEGSVDQHADQEIDGIKVFKNTISASVFYDTDAQSPCATLKDVAIKKINGGLQDGLLLYDKEHGAKTLHHLSYKGDTFHAKKILTESIQASAHLLNNIPSNKFIDKITANYISFGQGLVNVRDVLQVKVGEGLKCDDDGVSVNLASDCGLSLKSNKIKLDILKTQPINRSGQNLSDQDLIILSDVSTGATVHSTLSNLYDNYINIKVPHAAGSTGQLQLKGKSEFVSSPNLEFDMATNTLEVDGKTKSKVLVSRDKLIAEGAVYHSITKTSDSIYKVAEHDYTILCDTVANKIKVVLPPPQNNTGRVIVVKKVNTNKYKINSNTISIICEDAHVDINNQITIKMNYSSRTLQSDGENWWTIGSNGT